MSDDSLALNNPGNADAHPDAEFDAIIATIAATERGRWFLEEYAHRHRGADTESVVAGLERLEQAIRSSTGTLTADGLRRNLASMRAAIGEAREDIGQGGDALGIMLTLVEALDDRLRNLAELLTPSDDASASSAELSPGEHPAAAVVAAPAADEAAAWSAIPQTGQQQPAVPESAPMASADVRRQAQGIALPDSTASEAEPESSLTDWTYPTEDAPRPAPLQALPPDQAWHHPELQHRSPISLEQIEAREYQWQEDMVQDSPQAGLDDRDPDDRRHDEVAGTLPVEPPAHDQPISHETADDASSAITELIGPPPANDEGLVTTQSPVESHASHLPPDLLMPAHEPSTRADNPLFDTDLFDTGHGDPDAEHPSSMPARPLPAAASFEGFGSIDAFHASEFGAEPPDEAADQPPAAPADVTQPPAPWPETHPAPEGPVSEPVPQAANGEAPADQGAQGDTLIHRLEAMRAAISSLLDEVAEKNKKDLEKWQ